MIAWTRCVFVLRERPSSELYDYCRMIGLLSRCEMEQCGSRSYRAERIEDDYICMCDYLWLRQLVADTV